jgi:anthranilate synthase/aminodeoxychorismate synthase-like glutamine amidotransferase
MIDNYDSFTYCIAQYFRELGVEVLVKKNDELSIQQIYELAPRQIVISPGPCTPNEAGISLAAVSEFSGKTPLLGICLGHQVVGQAFGGRVVSAQKLMHGKTSTIQHNGKGVFSQLPAEFTVTRYHSLVLESSSLPQCFEVTAKTVESELPSRSEIMGIRHKNYAIQGLQFHPESILTEHGHALLNNFLLNAE